MKKSKRCTDNVMIEGIHGLRSHQRVLWIPVFKYFECRREVFEKDHPTRRAKKIIFHFFNYFSDGRNQPSNKVGVFLL